VEETIDIIVECILNEEEMKIPLKWRSRFPHIFDGLGASKQPTGTEGYIFYILI
jgi:hypothetical protein